MTTELAVQLTERAASSGSAALITAFQALLVFITSAKEVM